MDLDRQRAGSLRRRRRGLSRRRGSLFRRRLRNGPIETAAEILQEARQLSERSLTQRADLRLDGGLIARQVGRKARQLEADDRTKGNDDSEGNEHRNDNGRHPTETPPAQHLDKRSEHEGQEDRQHHGQEDVLADIEGGQDHNPDSQSHEPGEARNAGRLDFRFRGRDGRGSRTHSRDLCWAVKRSRRPANNVLPGQTILERGNWIRRLKKSWDLLPSASVGLRSHFTSIPRPKPRPPCRSPDAIS
jgi:hypothetical protein